MPEKIRQESGISGGLIRLATGLEATEDLIQDFTQAMGNV